jgi:hypothetical protein
VFKCFHSRTLYNVSQSCPYDENPRLKPGATSL